MSELTRINTLREKLGWGEKEIEELCKEIEILKKAKNNRKKEVVELLNRIGVSFSTKGRKYIVEGVLYILQHGEVKITRELYSHIAKKFDTNPAGVERSIRISINKCFKRKDTLLTEIFGNDRVTNSEFIYGLALYLSDY